MPETNPNDAAPRGELQPETYPAPSKAKCDDPGKSGPLSFSEVLGEELKEIDRSRAARGLQVSSTSTKGISGALDRNLIGLAFSGGGIRSATFNLGVLQSLAKFSLPEAASPGLPAGSSHPADSAPEGASREETAGSWSWLRKVDQFLRALQRFAGLSPEGGGIPGSEGAEQSGERSPEACRLLRQVDYLSTVSGGGYIGSWLIALLYRLRQKNGARDAFAALREEIVRGVGPHPEKEGEAVNFLRDYSNYLTPRKGILGADTWTAIAIYFRNTLLNFIILLLALSALLLLPRALAAAAQACSCDQPGEGAWLAIVALFAVALSVFLIARNMISLGENMPAWPPPFYRKEKWILIFVVGPLLFAGVLGTFWLWHHKNDWWTSYCVAAAWGALLYFVLTFPGGLAARSPSRDRKTGFQPPSPDRRAGFQPLWEVRHQRSISLFMALLAGAVGGLLLVGFEKLLCSWCGPGPGVYHFTVAAPSLLSLSFLAVGALHLGLIGRAYSDHQREWWGRLGAWILIFTLCWAALSALVFYGPLGAALLHGWIKTKIAALLAWLGTSAGGALAGSSPKTSGKAADQGAGKSPIESYASVAPYVFVLGLLLLLSCGIHATLNHFSRDGAGKLCAQNAPPCPPPAQTEKRESAPSGTLTIVQPLVAEATDRGKPEGASGQKNIQLNLQLQYQEPATDREKVYAEYWAQLAAQKNTAKGMVMWMAILLLLAAFLSWRVDLNEFSMQLLYRNRLVRCYLGATRVDGRRPDPFTGFDGKDDLLLSEFRAHPGDGYCGPFPIINTALNYTHGHRLAWQERKAESFVFTPLCSGYEFQEQTKMNPDEQTKAYRCTSAYAYPGGVYVGTAMGISGAAASPNMGYHTSPPVAFLMTVFNVRLGWWMGNPRMGRWQCAGPRFGLPYLLFELFATTNDQSGHVYLSDGGHFENLGIYELIRRRCRLIIACDADADPDYEFEDLGNAIRKCRSDFGVPIDIKIDSIRPQEDKERGAQLSRRHLAIGDIRYSAVDQDAHGQPVKDRDGLLVYLKTSLTGDEPGDVCAYKAAHPDFPQQSTAEQWFDESQFESYRALGEHVMDGFLTSLDLLADHEPDSAERLIRQVRRLQQDLALRQGN